MTDFEIHEDNRPVQGPRGRWGNWRIAEDGFIRRHDEPTPERTPSRSRSRSRSPLRELPQGRQARSKELCRDDRFRCHVLSKDASMTAPQISDVTGYTERQVYYSLGHPLTPKKDIPRPWKKRLDDEQLETLRQWLNEHPLRREINWKDFQTFIPGLFDVGIDAINTGMDFLGFERRYPGKKPRTDPSIRAERLEMCREALRLFPDPVDWVNGCIAFSDEKTFYSTKSGRRPVTIHRDEAVSDFRFLRQSGNRINHWGVICGRWKGPNFIFGFDIPNNARNYCVGPIEHANSFLHQVKQLT
ncbi:hypothetical protein H9Q70_009634, partial [Fusarium xylarioides]